MPKRSSTPEDPDLQKTPTTSRPRILCGQNMRFFGTRESWYRRIGLFASVYGIALLIAVWIPAMQWLNDIEAAFYVLLVAVIFMVPFAFTFINLGLADQTFSGKLLPETKQRRAELYRACPIWRFVYYGSFTLALASQAVIPLFHLPVQRMHGPTLSLSLLVGCWFLLARPIAKRIRDSGDNPARAWQSLIIPDWRKTTPKNRRE